MSKLKIFSSIQYHFFVFLVWIDPQNGLSCRYFFNQFFFIIFSVLVYQLYRVLKSKWQLVTLCNNLLVIRKIRSHSFGVFNSRDNSQKIRIQPGRTKNCQQFSSSSIIILAVHVFFSFVWKIEINYWFNLWSWTAYESKVDNLLL